MNSLNDQTVTDLRQMARRGESVASMFKELKDRLAPDASIVTILDYFRSAFCLTLAEAKPIAALSRSERREVEDEERLDELVTPAIAEHRSEWDETEH